MRDMSESGEPSTVVTSATVKPIRLVDQVRDILKERIFRGNLRPGDRIVEQRVAKELGVGQNAVREALIELAHLGFVQRTPNKGTYVTRLTRADAERIAPVRAALEGLAARLAAERMGREQLDLSRTEQLLARMRECAQNGDIVSFHGYDIEFHRSIWQLSDNEVLGRLLEQIVAPLIAFFIMLNLAPKKRGEYMKVVDLHQGIIDGIKSGSGECAQQAMQEFQNGSLHHQLDILVEEHME